MRTSEIIPFGWLTRPERFCSYQAIWQRTKQHYAESLEAAIATESLIDEKNNTVSFDTTGLDLSGNEGATLVNQLVTSSDTCGFALSDTATTAGGPVKLTNDPIRD